MGVSTYHIKYHVIKILDCTKMIYSFVFLSYFLHWTSCYQIAASPIGNFGSDGFQSFNGKCYKFFQEAKPWKEARRTCQLLAGDLVAVPNKRTNIFVEALSAGKPFWTSGVRDPTVASGWKWTSGEEWNYTNWRQGEPSNTAYGCMAINWDYTGSGFDDFSCKRDFSFICQKDTDYIGVSCDLKDSEKIQKIMKMLENIKDNLKAGSECSFGWINGGRYCYRVSEERLDWDAAREYCWNHGGYLAEFSSYDEEKKVDSFLNHDILYWIGLTYLDGEWKWQESGHNSSYTNWYEPNEEPDNTGDCVTKSWIYKDENGEWADDYCDDDYVQEWGPVHALCQKSKNN